MSTLRKTSLNWIFLIALIIAEYILFRNYVLNMIIPYYPQGFDQAAYLSTSYQLYERMTSIGTLNSIIHSNNLPQSFLFPFQAAIVFIFAGANRLSALTINFVYFAILQFVSFVTLKKITQSYLFSFLFIGILLSTHVIRLASDFRIDFISFCLYGILCGVILQSDIFLKKTWIPAIILTSIFIIFMRYITIVYIFGVFSLMLTYYVLLYTTHYNRALNIKIRIQHLLLSILILILVITPILWLNRQSLYSYYVIGHMVSSEKTIRLIDVLTTTHLSNHFLYIKIFMKYHLSFDLFNKILISFALLLACWMLVKVRAKKIGDDVQAITLRHNFIFLVIAILAPFIILSADTSKSIIVISIILTPLLYLFILIFFALIQQIQNQNIRLANMIMTAMTLFFVSVGIHDFHKLMTDDNENITQYRTVTQMVNDIGNYALRAHWKTVVLSTDQIADYIDAPITSFYYEMHKRYLNTIVTKLGINLTSVITRKDAMLSLLRSNVFTTVIRGKLPNNDYPYLISVKPYHNLLLGIAQKQMILLGDYQLDNATIRVFVRPPGTNQHGTIYSYNRCTNQ